MQKSVVVQKEEGNKGMLVVLAGFSGSGKNYIRKKLIETHSDEYISLVSATTRKMREGEQEGVEYYYKTEEEFDTLVSQGAFLEWETYAGNKYGILRSELDTKTANGKSAILIMETTGALTMKEKCGALTVFIMQKDSIATSKLSITKRNLSNVEAVARFREMKKASEDLEDFDYIIKNEFHSGDAVRQLNNVIQANKLRVSRNMSNVWELQLEVAEVLGDIGGIG